MPVDNNRIEKPVRKIRKFLKNSPKRPSVEQIHNLRTNCRRFEANMEALGLTEDGKQRHVLKDVVSIRKRCGKIRDVDVLTGYALGIQLPGEQDCLVQLIENLAASRSKQAKRLRSFCATEKRQLRRELKHALQGTEKFVGKKGKSKSSATSEASAEIMARALQDANELNSPAHLDKKNLHPYRLKVKELRYILQLAEDSKQQVFVRKLGEVKDAIGEWHDWEELIAIAEDVLDHGPNCELLLRLHEIAEAKYKRALGVTNEMRNNFLPALAKNRGTGHGKEAPTKFPVVAAASAIGA